VRPEQAIYWTKFVARKRRRPGRSLKRLLKGYSSEDQLLDQKKKKKKKKKKKNIALLLLIPVASHVPALSFISIHSQATKIRAK
jgi:hypothetical protein